VGLNNLQPDLQASYSKYIAYTRYTTALHQHEWKTGYIVNKKAVFLFLYRLYMRFDTVCSIYNCYCSWLRWSTYIS